ncbi:MAG TPA: divergent polysaccharide deacetylase family protein [Candidatus Hydrogenedentes bacterium]|nr:divergent polysaccharide deacetylase family protein [Candidatus Hydrogenedentota bacterium]
MAGTEHGKDHGRSIPLGWSDIFVLSLLITLFGALGFSVSAYLRDRPTDVTPLVNPLAEQFEQLLADNFIPAQNIRLAREDTVISGRERYNVRTYEILLPDTINWPGLRRLLVEALARKQVTLEESAGDGNTREHKVTLSLGRCPFVEAVFVTPETGAGGGPDCAELVDVARQAMLAVGVVSGAITMEPENRSKSSETSVTVHLPPGIDPLKLENALADAISPFDGYLEVVDATPGDRVIRMSHKSGPCAVFRLVAQPPAPAAGSEASLGAVDETAPTPETPPSSPAESAPGPSTDSGDTATSNNARTSFLKQTGHVLFNLVPPTVLLGSLASISPENDDQENVDSLPDPSVSPGPDAWTPDPSETTATAPGAPPQEPVPTTDDQAAADLTLLPGTPPRVAIILDDGGWGGRETEEILAMDSRLTLSILPHTPYGTETALRASELGFEIMLHMPMQNGKGCFPGEIRVDMDAETIRELTLRAVEQVPGACGTNNHTGTTFTRNRPGMEAFMDVVSELGWFFVDSRTTTRSVAYTVAVGKGVPALNREIFLDHVNTRTYIDSQFRALIALAKKNGKALAIGHFRPNTVQALKEWLPELDKQEIDLVHVSEILP